MNCVHIIVDDTSYWMVIVITRIIQNTLVIMIMVDLHTINENDVLKRKKNEECSIVGKLGGVQCLFSQG